MRDLVFEAAFLRDAVLVGLIHEGQVHEWAEDLLAADTGPAGVLAELLCVPVQLSPVREALRAFGDVDDPSRVTGALLSRAALDPAHHRLGDAHLLRVLSDVRRLAGCPAVWADGIVDFEAQASLATVGLRPSPPSTHEILAWLNAVRETAHFFVTCNSRQDALAFADALSRALPVVAADDQSEVRVGRDRDAWIVALDETAWAVARERLAPLPVASTVPYPGPMPLAGAWTEH